MKKALFLVAALLLVPGVAAAGGGMHEAGSCPGFAEGDTVVMRDGCFSGVAQFADSGDVTIVNEGYAPHSYTAVDGAFDTGLIDPGQTATLTGIDPGVYKVYCTLHADLSGNGMAGVLVVGDGGGAAAATPPIDRPGEATPAEEAGFPLIAGLATLAGGLALAGVGWWFHRRQVGPGAANPAT